MVDRTPHSHPIPIFIWSVVPDITVVVVGNLFLLLPAVVEVGVLRAALEGELYRLGKVPQEVLVAPCKDDNGAGIRGKDFRLQEILQLPQSSKDLGDHCWSLP